MKDVICHTCDNPSCVNIDHLFLGTVKDNTQDMLNKGRGFVQRQFGTNNSQSKLTDCQVKRIREFAEVGIKCKELARHFGVGGGVMSKIINRKSWKHI